MMQRFLTLTAAIAATVVSLSAGTVQTQIGLTNGLTGSTIGSANEGGWTEKNYDNKLFASTLGLSAQPYSTYSSTSANTGTLNDSSMAATTAYTTGVTFAMINDGCNQTPGGACSGGTAYSNNLWEAPVGSGASTITIPVNIWNVTDAWTMLNNQWGDPGMNDTTVTFNFLSPTSTNVSLVVALTNSNTISNGTTGQVRDGIDCTHNETGSPACTTFATGGIAGATLTATGAAASQLPMSQLSVVLNNLYSPAFTGTGASGPYAGLKSGDGTVALDDQGFLFGNAFQGYELLNIQVTENVGVNKESATALSAITVDSTVPEPSSVLLGIAGLAGVALLAGRRRRVA